MTDLFRFLNRLSLQKLRVRAEASGVMVIVILILDLHRFGAWYTGNQCHMKPFSVIALLIAGLPLLLYVITASVQKIISKEWFILLFMLRLYPFLIVPAMLNPISVNYLLKEPVWYDVPLYEGKIFLGIAVMMILAILYTAGFTLAMWIFMKIVMYGEKQTLVQYNKLSVKREKKSWEA